ncbi:MAG TPA: zinc ribbon domain-containing protein [Vicinamibacterales bacterium]|nr:zinc ribbon domain-containing protein [Vicinamibacterales bacterium]
MPIYEFRCRACHKKTTALVLSRERVSEVRCDRCGSADLDKLWSRFAAPKSEEARLEALADDSSLADVDENDPASMARFVKKMGEAMGEDLSGEFEAALDEESRRPDDADSASPAADGE